MRSLSARFVFLFCIGITQMLCGAQAPNVGVDPNDQASRLGELIEGTVKAADDNAGEISKALATIESDFKPGMEFLIAYMPVSDAKTLTAEFLLEHVRGAYEARNESPWKDQISDEVFLNNILPYASVSERREAWRADFRKRFLPMVASAKTPSEAAVILNQNIFNELGVKYSTKRKRADQGPFESMEGGTASCTGLSILLIDACRSVGVPARFVGTPRWSDDSGNHSWVEVWDGDWKFTGAAEPTGDKLNEGWFTERASTAKADKPMYSIYAVQYQKSETPFPLVWQKNFDTVWSVNVTDRYTKSKIFVLAEDEVLVRLKAVNPQTTQRVAANIVIRNEQDEIVFEGLGKDESFDANDHLNVALKKNSSYTVTYTFGDQRFEGAPITTTGVSPTAPIVLKVAKRVSEDPASWKEDNEPLTKSESQEASSQIWKFRANLIAASHAEEMKSKLIKTAKFPELEMKYEYKTFGEKPSSGHALFISMHGGGGAPARVNEQQWKNQIGLYEPVEGIYLAPRASTDTWNLWHQKHIDVFFDRIIENFVTSGAVDPNRVYFMGYSAGGDGVYQLAPRMADRLAAAAMMAGHPNETKPLGLRNLPFAIYMGGKDSAYDRNKIAGQWKDKLKSLRDADSEGYQHLVTIYPEKGHWMDGEDASALPWMAQHTRDPWPKKVVWHQDDVTHERFYWLSVPAGLAKKRTTVTATISGQQISVKTDDVSELRIWLSDELLDLDQEVNLVINGKLSKPRNVQRTRSSFLASLESRNDEAMMAPAFIDVSISLDSTD